MNEALKNQPHVDLSLVIACYNSSNCLEENFKQIMEVLRHTQFSYEVIMVEDKSKDRTADVVRALKQAYPEIRAIFHRKNAGRGKTVYDGFRHARGRVIGFIDIDLDNPARYIFPLVLKVLMGQTDVCTARRIYLFKKNPYLVLRWILSRGYTLMVKWILDVRLADTETGCKFFLREKAMPILAEVKNRGWFWDTEVMARCYFGGLRIHEMPTLFIRTSTISTVDILPDIWRYLLNLFQFRKVAEELKTKANLSNRSLFQQKD